MVLRDAMFENDPVRGVNVVVIVCFHQSAIVGWQVEISYIISKSLVCQTAKSIGAVRRAQPV